MRLIIMCKAPVAGQVKTRLMGAYTPEQAAALHAAMAAATIRKACRMFRHVWLAADAPDHPFFQGFGVTLLPQGQGDLGSRMQRLLRQSFADAAMAVMFVGTDSPHTPESRWRSAESMLQGAELVVGPVEDGGYDLIALGSCHPEVFDGIDWGSGRVLVQTRAAAGRAGLSLAELSLSYDLDRPQDIERAGQEGFLLGQASPYMIKI